MECGQFIRSSAGMNLKAWLCRVTTKIEYHRAVLSLSKEVRKGSIRTRMILLI